MKKEKEETKAAFTINEIQTSKQTKKPKLREHEVDASDCIFILGGIQWPPKVHLLRAWLPHSDMLGEVSVLMRKG